MSDEHPTPRSGGRLAYRFRHRLGANPVKGTTPETAVTLSNEDATRLYTSIINSEVVGWQGLEPWTNALKGHCSTN